MDWKGPVASTIFAALVLFTGLWIEPVFPLGDDRWGIMAGISALAIVALYTPSAVRAWRNRRRRSVTPVAVDYLQACAIVNGYIDPDETMRDRTRLSVRTAILQRFESVVGAKIGENYNGAVLHQWMQKNAARILVENLGKMI